ncbi:relaxase domain-containing protein [Streptomyces sp. NPDC003042]
MDRGPPRGDLIRSGKDGIHRVRPPGGLVAARFRHHESRAGMPLLHDHLLLSIKGQRPGGKLLACSGRSAVRLRCRAVSRPGRGGTAGSWTGARRSPLNGSARFSVMAVAERAAT